MTKLFVVGKLLTGNYRTSDIRSFYRQQALLGFTVKAQVMTTPTTTGEICTLLRHRKNKNLETLFQFIIGYNFHICENQ